MDNNFTQLIYFILISIGMWSGFSTLFHTIDKQNQKQDQLYIMLVDHIKEGRK